MTFSIYLDVCCFNRPFDDQTQERIRLESEAVAAILTRCQRGEWQLLGSETIDTELKGAPDGERKKQTQLWAASAKAKILITEQIETRGLELIEIGFKDFDALHIACAEAGKADILQTTDDRMLRLAARHQKLLQVRVGNPFQWLIEVTNDKPE
ncbi:PIN domain-containing protein [Scytonema sp. NUACC26]|uniref:PIN domain-containing protein n=1 Tax=Scytonema sp. NUACC26 TaxID=3140176 RepID=UPI0034DBD0E9